MSKLGISSSELELLTLKCSLGKEETDWYLDSSLSTLTRESRDPLCCSIATRSLRFFW